MKEGVMKDNMGFRIGHKGKENDIGATFRSLHKFKPYPNSDPARVPVHGDMLDNMFCPSTDQILLVEEVAKKSGKRIMTNHDLKKHDMNAHGMLKKDKHTKVKPPAS